jgi:hypothetical protein
MRLRGTWRLNGASARFPGTVRRLAVLAAALALAACVVQARFALDSANFFPTALDYWPGRGVLLVGSYDTGAVHAISTDGVTGRELLPAAAGDGRRTLRLKVDPVRSRLWVLDTGGVTLYSLPEGEPLRRFDLPPLTASKAACLPDLALDAAGGGYVSDNHRPLLYRLQEHAGRAEPVVLRFGNGTPHRDGFSALIAIADPPVLIAGSAATGRLWAIDGTTGHSRLIATPRAVEGLCGLARVPPETLLRYYGLPLGPLVVATTGFADAVVKFQLTPDLRYAEVSRLAPYVAVRTPISIVQMGAQAMVAASQLDRHPDFAAGARPRLPFRLVLIPHGLETPMLGGR